MRSEHLKVWQREATGPIHTMVDETGVPIGAPPGATDKKQYDATDYMRRRVQRDRSSMIYLEGLRIHHEQPTTLRHNPAQRAAHFQTGEIDRDRNLGDKNVSAASRDVT